MQTHPLSKKHRILLSITLILLSFLFFIGGPKYQSPRSFQAAWNLGHIIFFALLPLLIFSIPKKKQFKPTFQAAIIIGLTLAIGVIVELLQYGMSRTPDIGDISRNMVGAMIAILILLPTRNALPKPMLTIFQSITILLAAAQFYPIIIALVDEHQARRNFPVLCDFQTPLQINRWSESDNTSITAPPNNPDNLSLKIDLSTRKYSGASLKYFPKNWTGYNFFQFRVFNPSTDQIKLTCRIHDKKHRSNQVYHDRYNKTYKIPQGWNTIIIDMKKVQQAPKSRNMDLNQIYGIGIFATQLPHPRTIYIDDLKLF